MIVVDAFVAVPFVVLAATIVAGTVIGFCILLVVNTLHEDAACPPVPPRRARSGESRPDRESSPGLGGSPFDVVMAEWRRQQSYRRAGERANRGRL